MRYAIHSRGGACHSFITQLLINLYTDGEFQLKIDPDLAHCHVSTYQTYLNTLDLSFDYKGISEPVDPAVTTFVISITKRDIPKVEANHFYKNVQNAKKEENPYYWKIYKQLVKNKVLPKRSITFLNELPKEESQILVEKFIEDFIYDGEFSFSKDTKFTELKFRDIYFNMNGIINQLETVTGKKAQPSLYEGYNRYMEEQERFRIKHFTWIAKYIGKLNE
jgi:hypothetical protein